MPQRGRREKLRVDVEPQIVYFALLKEFTKKIEFLRKLQGYRNFWRFLVSFDFQSGNRDTVSNMAFFSLMAKMTVLWLDSGTPAEVLYLLIVIVFCKVDTGWISDNFYGFSKFFKKC